MVRGTILSVSGRLRKASNGLENSRKRELTLRRPTDILNHMVKCFPKSLNRVFFALSDPTRRAILARLADGQLTITALAAPFAISFVAVSKHIRVLEHAGLLKRSKQGREYHLRLVPQPLHDAAAWLDQYERFWTDQLHHIKARAEQKARERSAQKPNS
jgi:DNA-binding transcriptional ArsR family regulator